MLFALTSQVSLSKNANGASPKIIEPTLITSSIGEGVVAGGYLLLEHQDGFLIYQASSGKLVLSLPKMHRYLWNFDLSKFGILAIVKKEGVHLIDLKNKKEIGLIRSEAIYNEDGYAKEVLAKFSYKNTDIIYTACPNRFIFNNDNRDFYCGDSDNNFYVQNISEKYLNYNRLAGGFMDSSIYTSLYDRINKKVFSPNDYFSKKDYQRIIHSVTSKDESFVYFTGYVDAMHDLEYEKSRMVEIFKVNEYGEWKNSQMKKYQIFHRNTCNSAFGSNILIIKVNKENFYFSTEDGCGEFIKKINRSTNQEEIYPFPLTAEQRVEVYEEPKLVAQQKALGNLLLDGKELDYKKYLNKKFQIIDSAGKILCNIKRYDIFDTAKKISYLFNKNSLVIFYPTGKKYTRYIEKNKEESDIYQYFIYKLC